MPRLSLISLLLATATAHFTINTPPARSPSSEAGLAKGPCGGAALDFGGDGSVSDFHVGGDAVAVTGTHPESNWLIRATNDTEGRDNWVRLVPIVKQSGLGKMCQPEVTVPEDWVGSEGLIGVVANAEDGVLFACSQVKFVEGKGDKPSSCTNTTSNIFPAEDGELEALVGDNSGADAGSEDPPEGEEDDDDDGAAVGLRVGLLSVGLAALGALVL